jgi:hypothetical protein
LNRLSFISILLRHEAKGMKLKNEAKKIEMGMLGIEILDLKGEKRERAMKTYRKLLSASTDELTYLARV